MQQKQSHRVQQDNSVGKAKLHQKQLVINLQGRKLELETTKSHNNHAIRQKKRTKASQKHEPNLREFSNENSIQKENLVITTNHTMQENMQEITLAKFIQKKFQ